MTTSAEGTAGMDGRSIRALLDRLGVIKLPGGNGPYSPEEVSAAEEELGVPFAPTHRELLASVGGVLGFEVGAVEIKGAGSRSLSRILGLDGFSHDIRSMAKGYAGQIPPRWVPFGEGDWDHTYLIAPDGSVHCIKREERYWARPSCPEAPPPNAEKLADSLEDFLRLLELPVWARSN